MSDLRVQVGIVGAGPAGLMLAHLLGRAGISFVLVERQTQAYVESRIRAGVLEQGTVALLDRAQLGVRMRAEGLVHDGIELAWDSRRARIDFKALTGASVMVYGQTEITRDLTRAHAAAGSICFYAASEVSLHDLEHRTSTLRFVCEGQTRRASCDFIVGCDGFHGVSRQAIPAALRHEYERVYPFGWLGVLSDTPPVSPELIYANHARGFALCSMRSNVRSRYYVQVAADEAVEAWPDLRFWDELRRRLPADVAESLVTGASIEKGIAPLRSFVVEPMRYGNLFLAGDAAHIVPPTGAKGLNLALGDVAYLAQAFTACFGGHDCAALETYSAERLARVWQAERFSWWFTSLLHRLSDDPFTAQLQRAELAYLATSPSAMTSLAENYVGPPSAPGDN